MLLCLTIPGSIASVGFVGVQGVLNAKLSAGDAAKAWQEVWVLGSTIVPRIVTLPALSFGYLAYDAFTASSMRMGPFRNTAFYLYTFAAIAMPAIAPYTLTVMAPTNDSLHKKAKAGGEGNIDGLLKTWVNLNWFRSLIVASGTLAGAWAAFGGLP